MKKFVHSSHTALEFRQWKPRKVGVVLIKETGNRMSLASQFHRENIRLHYNRPNKYQWFAFVRMPLFFFEKNNSGFKIGTPNIYFWFIK